MTHLCGTIIDAAKAHGLCKCKEMGYCHIKECADRATRLAQWPRVGWTTPPQGVTNVVFLEDGSKHGSLGIATSPTHTHVDLRASLTQAAAMDPN